ncbi:GAF and ANTAR domain-containing protein [Arthrobacter sp. B0490]|uniref:GAF and ANTAR domain-containing protein n=1 Tax=Arthrobacter sp. B0490 TaxID=2058891 RepID=UPI000CE320C0|nr:GAF and ANTAR domain-containing protein [Arthrobacter sp. B0490]
MQDNTCPEQHPAHSDATDPQALMLEDQNIEDFLDHLAVLGEQLFANGESVPCGLMSRRGNRHLSVKSSSETAAALNEIHHDVGEGPSFVAIAANEIVVVDDARHDARWPRYFSSSAVTGFASMLSVPLKVGNEGIAALNFYARPAGYFTSEKQRVAAVFAAQAGKALEMAMRVARYQDAAFDMRTAMEARTTIDMAVGIIIGQNRCTQEEAFEILRRASNTRNKKIRDIARGLVVHATGSTPRTHFTN